VPPHLPVSDYDKEWRDNARRWNGSDMVEMRRRDIVNWDYI